jgi:hypothetical protein
VAHAYSSSYSGGRDQEDLSSKPAWRNSSLDPVSNNPSLKRAGGVVQGVGPAFKSQHGKKTPKTQYIYIYVNSSLFTLGKQFPNLKQWNKLQIKFKLLYTKINDQKNKSKGQTRN